MEKVNVGIRTLSCGCLMNTSLQSNGVGKVDVYPCKDECKNLAMILQMAEATDCQIDHLWNE